MRPSTIFRTCKLVRFSQYIWITDMTWICSILGQQTLTSNTQAKSEKTKDIHRAMRHVLSWSTTHSLLFNVREKLRLSKYFYPKDFLLIERDNRRRNVCWTTIDVHYLSLSLLLSSDSPTEARSCEVIERALRASCWHKHIRLFRLVVQTRLVLFNGRLTSVHVRVWNNTGRSFAASREYLGSSRLSSFTFECRWFQTRSGHVHRVDGYWINKSSAMLISSVRLRWQVVNFEQILVEYGSMLRVIFCPTDTPKRIGRLLIYGKILQRSPSMMHLTVKCLSMSKRSGKGKLFLFWSLA